MTRQAQRMQTSHAWDRDEASMMGDAHHRVQGLRPGPGRERQANQPAQNGAENQHVGHSIQSHDSIHIQRAQITGETACYRT